MSDIRNPWIAAVFSIFFPGWGQWYNGRTRDGLKIFGASIVAYIFASFVMSRLGDLGGFLIFLIIWIYGIYDSYKMAGKINRNEVEFKEKSPWFWLPVALYIISISVAVIIAATVYIMASP